MPPIFYQAYLLCSKNTAPEQCTDYKKYWSHSKTEVKIWRQLSVLKVTDNAFILSISKPKLWQHHTQKLCNFFLLKTSNYVLWSYILITCFNSLTSTKCGCNLEVIFFKLISNKYIWNISCATYNCPHVNATRPDYSVFISQIWCHQQQVITWANVGSDLCRHMLSLGHNELNLQHDSALYSLTKLRPCTKFKICNLIAINSL